MPADPEPPELAQLVTFAERSRTGDWSLRSALVRYAQGQPQRVSDLLEAVRRVEAALHGHDKEIRRTGPALWAALSGGAPADADQQPIVDLLREVARLDALADALADWADDHRSPSPDAEVDQVTTEVSRRLDDLGIPREERTGPPPRRRR